VDYTGVWDFFDKIYCISVEQRHDRRQAAQKEFARIGLLERVEFVLVEKHPDNPEQGIYQSHLLCMEKAIAAGAETILIFEDDIVFQGVDEENLGRALTDLQMIPGWNALFLGCIVRQMTRTASPSLVRIRYQCLTHAYAVTRDFAQHLVQIPWQGTPYDGLLKQENNQFFALHPMIGFQSNSPTDNHTVKIDAIRRFLGGLQRIQRLNEWFHYHKKIIVVSHAAALVLLGSIAWFVLGNT
jgi:GR25 family glycosyltransferase involved in LPS biosynthesis